MNIFVLLPLQKSMAQRGPCKHDQWRGYMTFLVVNDGIIKSISTLPMVIRMMMKFDIDKPGDCFHQEVKWTLAIRYQLSTLSGLNLDNVHQLPPALLPEKDTYFLPEANKSFPNALRRIQSGGDQNALQCCPLLIE